MSECEVGEAFYTELGEAAPDMARLFARPKSLQVLPRPFMRLLVRALGRNAIVIPPFLWIWHIGFLAIINIDAARVRQSSSCGGWICLWPWRTTRQPFSRTLAPCRFAMSRCAGSSYKHPLKPSDDYY